MINRDVLRIIIAKGSGDGNLKKISKYIANEPSCILNDVCNDIELMCSMGINQDVAKIFTIVGKMHFFWKSNCIKIM